MTTADKARHNGPELTKYELLEEIGYGGMATVYRANDRRLGREVAVKIIHKHLRENAEVRRRFVAEARAVAKLRHRSIVEVYDVSDEEMVDRYLVVELIKGPSLRQVLIDHGPLPAEVAASFVLELCDAVEHAHRSQVIHRDIKPENVLIGLANFGEAKSDAPHSGDKDSGPSGARRSGEGYAATVKLTDFGIAKVLDAQGVTSTGQILGSPAHMAPEQIEGGDISTATDVFALGVLMYECMVGHLPFEGNNPAQVLRRVLDGDCEDADREQPAVGRRWAEMIEMTLMVDPADRIQSARALGELIAAELQALDVDDHRNELDRFFAAPDTYREEAPDRLIPLLMARGTQARRQGDAISAADDFNRALALRPHDATILRQVTALHRRNTGIRFAQRAALIAGVCVALGTGAFYVTRFAQGDSLSHRLVSGLDDASVDVSGPSSNPPSVPPDTVESGITTSAPVVSGGGRVRPIRLRPRPSAQASASGSASAAASVGARQVRFNLHPGGAKLTLDGAALSWFGQVHTLSVGTHQVDVRMPSSNSCCEAVAKTVSVAAPPDGAPEQIQTVSVVLPLRKARATLVGGPAGATVVCPNGLVVANGATASITLSDLRWHGACEAAPGGASVQVELFAGKTATINWPGS